MELLSQIAGLASLVCAIMVIVKFFQNNMALHGVIGIVTCGIWALIWGWVQHKKLGIQKLMLVWTVIWVVAWVTGLQSGTIRFSMNT